MEQHGPKNIVSGVSKIALPVGLQWFCTAFTASLVPSAIKKYRRTRVYQLGAAVAFVGASIEFLAVVSEISDDARLFSLCLGMWHVRRDPAKSSAIKRSLSISKFFVCVIVSRVVQCPRGCHSMDSPVKWVNLFSKRFT